MLIIAAITGVQKQFWAVKRGHRTGVFEDVFRALANVSVTHHSERFDADARLKITLEHTSRHSTRIPQRM